MPNFSLVSDPEMHSHRRSAEVPKVEATPSASSISVHQPGSPVRFQSGRPRKVLPPQQQSKVALHHKDRQAMKAAVPYMHRASQSAVPSGRPHGSQAFYDLSRNADRQLGTSFGSREHREHSVRSQRVPSNDTHLYAVGATFLKVENPLRFRVSPEGEIRNAEGSLPDTP